ncbi:MAG: tetratricopeptide repeat protein [Fidelibacterota bacterium]|nr:MAG: tetratricopeptide repeat protein [Candidatus Neomarinimicrobiota bacterium]
MGSKRWFMEAAAAPIGLAAMMLGLSLGQGIDLKAQDQQDEDIYLPDLGIIIEPEGSDSIGQIESPSMMEDVSLMVGKEPPGAAFIESTRELRAVLGDLSGKIDTLENSLNQDMESVRLENERLRTLIRKIQANRKEAEVSEAVDSHHEKALPEPQPTASFPIPAESSYQRIFEAYRSGLFTDVIALCQVLERAPLLPEEDIQVAYWCADAYFRQGLFQEALTTLEKVQASDHELKDDAIVLAGLIYLRQGKPDEALSRFQTIVSQYPASDYHRLAELTIKELNQL